MKSYEKMLAEKIAEVEAGLERGIDRRLIRLMNRRDTMFRILMMAAIWALVFYALGNLFPISAALAGEYAEHSDEPLPLSFSDLPERPDGCREWLKWLVDGNQGPPWHSVRIQISALTAISVMCLDREPDPYHQPPIPDYPKHL